MIQSSEMIMILIYGVLLVTFFIGWSIVRRVNMNIDREEAEKRANTVWARCACGFEKIYDLRKLTLTECPKCGNPVVQPL